MSAVFHLSKINSYKPIVSDVSNDDFMETVKQIKKSDRAYTRSGPYDAIRCFQNDKGAAVLFDQEICEITTHLSI